MALVASSNLALLPLALLDAALNLASGNWAVMIASGGYALQIMKWMVTRIVQLGNCSKSYKFIRQHKLTLASHSSLVLLEFSQVVNATS